MNEHDDPQHHYSVADTVDIMVLAHQRGYSMETIDRLTIQQLDALVRANTEFDC